MPETRGADLETTGAAFGAMGAAGGYAAVEGAEEVGWEGW